MAGRGTEAVRAPRAITYCVVPSDLAAKLHDTLRRHFAHDARVEVIVEQRTLDRRSAHERREVPSAGSAERRAIRAREGRRVGERRALVATVPVPELPRRARPHADRLVFLERIEQPTLHAEDLDTQRLVAAFQAGRREAFADLYMRYFDRIYAYLRVALNDAHEAEDATQQVFTKLFESLPRYERTRAPFRGWLFTIVRNYAISAIEKRSRVQIVASDEIDRRGEAGAELEEPDLTPLEWISDRELLMFVERLPLPQRQVLMLRYMLDLSHADVAAVLGRSPDDVRVLQSRALAFIRARLAALGRTPSRQRGRMVRVPRKATVLRGRRFALLSRL